MNDKNYKWYPSNEVFLRKGDFVYNRASGSKGIINKTETGTIFYTNENGDSCSWARNEDLMILKEEF